jgi:hypothetical protein
MLVLKQKTGNTKMPAGLVAGGLCYLLIWMAA